MLKRVIIISVSAIVLASGCSTPTIKAWERGNLSKEEMAWSTDPLASQLSDHIYFAKEAAAGGYGSAGGGCGCN